jgi:hypothetical protein
MKTSAAYWEGIARTATSKEERERAARLAEMHRLSAGYHFPAPAFPIKLKKEIALKIANTGYRELMKKAHPDVGGSKDESAQLSQVMTWLRRTIEVGQ